MHIRHEWTRSALLACAMGLLVGCAGAPGDGGNISSIQQAEEVEVPPPPPPPPAIHQCTGGDVCCQYVGGMADCTPVQGSSFYCSSSAQQCTNNGGTVANTDLCDYFCCRYPYTPPVYGCDVWSHCWSVGGSRAFGMCGNGPKPLPFPSDPE